MLAEFWRRLMELVPFGPWVRPGDPFRNSKKNSVTAPLTPLKLYIGKVVEREKVENFF